MVAELLQRLGLTLPQQSRIIENAVENVVQKTGGLMRANPRKSALRLSELRKMG
jgi:hypothetical protein